MSFIEDLTKKVLEEWDLTFKEGIELITIDSDNAQLLKRLFEGANKIREKFCGDRVNLCTIMNAKSGRCSENCKYCAQSGHYKTDIDEYSLVSYEEILERAKSLEKKGVHKFSLVTSGKGIVSEKEFIRLIEIYNRLQKDTGLNLCASHGIISREQAIKLKSSGVSMYHHNIETSREYFPKICSTHTFEDRVMTIKNVKEVGLDICCGGIIGMGESLEDRINMAITLRKLEIKSIPINVLNPIKGTPFHGLRRLQPNEILKTMAIFRYINPKAYIRYAGGRIALGNRQDIGFRAGVNAALVGDFLTTVGSEIGEDKNMIKKLGLNI